MDMSKCLDSKKRSSHDVEVLLAAGVVVVVGGVNVGVVAVESLPLGMIGPKLGDFKLDEMVAISMAVDLAK